jgi:hypothetical protein
MLGKFGPNARKTENSPLRLHSTPLAGSQSHYKKAPFCLLSSVGCRRPSSFPMRPTSSSPARSPPTSSFPMPPHLLHHSVALQNPHRRRIRPPSSRCCLHRRAATGCQAAAATTGSPPHRRLLSLSLSSLSTCAATVTLLWVSRRWDALPRLSALPLRRRLKNYGQDSITNISTAPKLHIQNNNSKQI